MYSSDTIFWEGILKSFDNFTVFGIKLPQSCYSDGRYTGRQAVIIVNSTSLRNSQKFLYLDPFLKLRAQYLHETRS